MKANWYYRLFIDLARPPHHLQDSIHCDLHVTNGCQSLFYGYLDSSRLLHHRLDGLRLLLDFGKLEVGIGSGQDEFEVRSGILSLTPMMFPIRCYP